MLDVKNLQVSYGSTEAVAGADLSVGRGEAVALLGSNGAGKTSTLRAISRLIPATGDIEFEGNRINGLAPEELARRGLIHVPEGRHVFSTLSVDDNLKVGMTARAKRSAKFTLDDVYDLFPALQPLRKRYGWALSGGEQQMVAIGRALLASPKLLMLDEPSLGLAPIVVSSVYTALAKVKQEMPILLVEQNASVALSICDHGVVLLSGQVAMSGSADELGDRSSLMDSYLGHSGTDETSRDPQSSAEVHGPALENALPAARSSESTGLSPVGVQEVRDSSTGRPTSAES